MKFLLLVTKIIMEHMQVEKLKTNKEIRKYNRSKKLSQ